MKLTIVPTHSRAKVTEMVVRQNTQFTFAERLAYCHTDLLRSVPVTVDTLRRAIKGVDDVQSPFVLHGVWQTVGSTHILNMTKTADVYMISDFAYLSMLLSKTQEKNGVPTRVGQVVNRICSWLTDYFETGGMAYKITKKQSVDHLKVNLYPSGHLDELKAAYHDMRLSLQDLDTVIPRKLRLQFAPE